MKKFIVLMLTFCFVLSGCAHLNMVMKSWEGHHYGELIASWGPPQQVFDDGYGGRILVYTKQRSWTTPGTSSTYTTGQATAWDNYIWGSVTSRSTYNPPQTYGYTAYRMFWINSDGHIYRWAWRGL